MPVKGDDLDALVATNAIAHHANTDLIYSEKAYAGVHPSSKSLSLLRSNDSGGIFEKRYVIAPDGVQEGVEWILACNEADVPNYSQGAYFTILKDLVVVEVVEVDSARDGEVVFTLKKIRDA